MNHELFCSLRQSIFPLIIKKLIMQITSNAIAKAVGHIIRPYTDGRRGRNKSVEGTVWVYTPLVRSRMTSLVSVQWERLWEPRLRHMCLCGQARRGREKARWQRVLWQPVRFMEAEHVNSSAKVRRKASPAFPWYLLYVSSSCYCQWSCMMCAAARRVTD